MDPFTIALATFGVQKLRGKSTSRALRDAALAGGIGYGIGQLGGAGLGIGQGSAFSSLGFGAQTGATRRIRSWNGTTAARSNRRYTFFKQQELEVSYQEASLLMPDKQYHNALEYTFSLITSGCTNTHQHFFWWRRSNISTTTTKLVYEKHSG
jgi:hypothetical protein